MSADMDLIAFLDEAFEQNYARLKEEMGHSVTIEMRLNAKKVVFAYWLKKGDLAKKVTETEVRLGLPGQKVPGSDREFTIEGIVDVVKEGDKTIMYDIKTHEYEYLKQHLPDFEDQLNVYAYIWNNLREMRLDKTAILAASFPDDIKKKINALDFSVVNEAAVSELRDVIKDWEPELHIDYSNVRVKKTIAEFATTVKRIEDHEFEAAPLERLREVLVKQEGGSRKKDTFAARICAYCDARYSCSTYHEHVRKEEKLAKDSVWDHILQSKEEDDDEAEMAAVLEAEHYFDRLDRGLD